MVTEASSSPRIPCYAHYYKLYKRDLQSLVRKAILFCRGYCCHAQCAPALQHTPLGEGKGICGWATACCRRAAFGSLRLPLFSPLLRKHQRLQIPNQRTQQWASQAFGRQVTPSLVLLWMVGLIAYQQIFAPIANETSFHQLAVTEGFTANTGGMRVLRVGVDARYVISL